MKIFVTTAVRLDENRQKRLEEKIRQKFNCSIAEVIFELDESIIGGVIVHSIDFKIDGSLKAETEQFNDHVFDGPTVSV